MGLDGRFVALRKESVDRNTMRRDFKALGLLSLSARRAWIEIKNSWQRFCKTRSLSARRAWIEINRGRGRGRRHCVALRKESVDRNRDSRNSQNINRGSLSARRAWIEIWWLRCWQLAARVALRKESVDRNRSREKSE